MAENDDEGIRGDKPADERGDRPVRRREDRRYDEDEDDRRDRIRRREGDVTGGLIPYKNPMALASYYCGVFGLISCFLLLGIFGILPIVFGFKGLKHAKLYPESRGQAHAIVGIVLGSIEVLSFLACAGLIIAVFIFKK
jgi:hypothetical protein